MKNIRFKDDEKLSEIYEKVNLSPFRNYVYNFDGFGTYCNYLDEYECAIDDRDDKIEKYKEVIDRLNFIKNRKNQGASQENINKMAIEFVNSWLKEV